MNRIFFLFLILIMIFLVQSCAGIRKPAMRQDPLIGKIVDARTSAPVAFEALIQDISRYDVIYLSEKHDNPEHHAVQQRVIRALIEAGKSPVLGFEFFSHEDTPDLLNFIEVGQVAHPRQSDKAIEKDLRKKLSWDTHSDTMWGYYFDLLKTAQENRLMAAGLDLPTTLKRRITRRGFNGLTTLEKERIFSTDPPGRVYRDYMFSIFKAVHCGMGHQRMQERLYDTWLARNDRMALSITELFRHMTGPIVVIMGGGHTEYGLGVPDRVNAINSEIRQVNLAIKEINTDPAPIEAYTQPLELGGYAPVPPADFLWFTQRVSYEDPCVEFRKKIKGMAPAK